MALEVPGKFQKSSILFAHVVENANRTVFFRGEPENLAPGTSQLPLNGLHLFDGQAKMSLEKLF